MIDRYDFDQSLRTSAQHANDPFWAEVYRKAFPDFYNRIVVSDLTLQFQGIDSVIELRGGGTLNVDEKVRDVRDKRGRTITPQTHGVLLEEWSVVGERKGGWWRADKRTHHLAYAFLATQQCYLFPFQSLRRTRVEFGEEWLELARNKERGFLEVRSASRRGAQQWETFSIAVPVDELKQALSDVMDIAWGDGPIVVPSQSGKCNEMLPGGGLCGVKLSADNPGPLCRWHQTLARERQDYEIRAGRPAAPLSAVVPDTTCQRCHDPLQLTIGDGAGGYFCSACWKSRRAESPPPL